MINLDPNGIPELSLRQLRFFMSVYKLKSVTKAANELNRSQTAITKSITDLEKSLNVSLFDRVATGMIANAYGEAFATRTQRAIDEFQKASQSFASYSKLHMNSENNPIFSMDVSYKRLAAFISLYHCKNVHSAADQLNVTKAAIYSSVRQLEVWLGIFLFESEPQGVVPTPYCNVLAQHLKLAFSEIRYALEDLANLDGVTSGSVKIGTLPYTRTYLTPQAINLLLDEHHNLDVSTREGPYNLLEVSLRNGDIDFIIGAIRPSEKDSDLNTEILLEDKLSVIARSNHPLMGRENLSLGDLSDYGWVLPELHTPSGRLFLELMKAHGLPIPTHSIHTSSLSMVRGLLMGSDRVTLLSKHQIYYDRNHELLDVLPVDIGETYRPIGITMRRRTEPSPAAQLFLDKLRQVADSVNEH
ncbi:transcriptional regulator, LysR family [Paraglaciecola sp. T6c]|uniref:LysR family transcriptional regulator n=1 Tax=Pseudoalteromonas atlantica (strain T6c / ATCC BAA-1087) TaxID=3042615 RepID=UPI00005C6D75|nr:LysR family transcriptional regulator [Paraglaciecola sp. T6c]ABG42397.1 transcriptional regulator, LysR family [Paraglaciecola sp. T6c]